jgi:hypothetical protein
MTTRFVGWPGVTDVVGGQQMLVQGGLNVAPPLFEGAHHILDYNPHTTVGITRTWTRARCASCSWSPWTGGCPREMECSLCGRLFGSNAELERHKEQEHQVDSDHESEGTDDIESSID